MKFFRLLLSVLSVSSVVSCSLFDALDKEDNTEIIRPNAVFSCEKEVFKGDDVVFQNNSTDADRFEWSFGDGAESIDENPTHVFKKCGCYTVRLKAYKGEEYNEDSELIRVTSKTIEVTSISAVKKGAQYFPSGKYVNGNRYKYEFTIDFKGSWYGYKSASRFGVNSGNSYMWWDADSETESTLTIKHYSNERSFSLPIRAYAVMDGGNTYGDVFGKTITLSLNY